MIHILQKVISSQIISRLFVMALLLLTLQVTPVLWSQQLVWLEYLVVGGCLVMAISSLFLKTNCQLTVVDILVTVWWYIFLCAYLKTGYPCSYEMTVYSVLYGLYVLLRFLFSVFPLRDGILEHLFMFAAFSDFGSSAFGEDTNGSCAMFMSDLEKASLLIFSGCDGRMARHWLCSYACEGKVSFSGCNLVYSCSLYQ